MDAAVQFIFTALAGNPDFTSQNACNTTTNLTTTTTLPTNIPSLITSLFSTSALREWFKLFVIGGVFEFCRRSIVSGYYAVYNWFFITAIFMEGDSSFDWIMVWLAKQPSWVNARDVQISTKSYGLTSNAVLIPGEEDDDPNAVVNGDRPLSYIPSLAASHTFWYHHRWCRVRRLQQDSGQWYRTKDEYLELCILSWDQHVLNELLLEAKKAYKAAQEDAINIYASEPHSGWRHIASRPKRPLSSIVLDPGVKDELVEDARDFLESKNWYSVRGIPFRRGYLLYGAPGCGKTSIIHSLAGELGLDIYIISLSRSGIDDSSLNQTICELPEKCIALMEDIDAAFTTPSNRQFDNENQDDKNNKKQDPNSGPPQPTQDRVSKITLSGLLNALDGVAAQEGRLLFATTNKYETLDPALTRPGRMDLHIEFKLASKYQARELYRCFFLPDSDLIAELEARSKGQTRKNTEEDNEETKEKEDLTEKSSSLIDVLEEIGSTNVSETSTIAAPSESSSPSQKLISLPDITTPSLPSSPTSQILSDETALSFRRKTKAPKLSKTEVNRLATEFSNALPDRQFSMASLQGYLMAYKTRPLNAVSSFPAWIEKERKEKARKSVEEKEKAEKEAREKEEKNKLEVTAKGSEGGVGGNEKADEKASTITQTATVSS